MSDPKQPKLEIQISSSLALVRRMDQQLELVARLLADAESAHALVPTSFTNHLGMKMIWCPPGKFLMGSPEDEKDRRENENQVQVLISHGLWLASTPVTQGQWQALMGNNPSHFTGSMDLPVEQVSWNDVWDFCAKLNAVENLPNSYHYALPTEAQWKYACRAGTTTPFHFGSTLNGKIANCSGDDTYGTETDWPYLGQTSIVGSYSPNSWGLHDMHGNVWEWCADWNGDRLPGGIDPSGPTTGAYRRTRGGAWSDSAALCSSAYRNGDYPDNRRHFVGFRPAIVLSR